MTPTKHTPGPFLVEDRNIFAGSFMGPIIAQCRTVIPNRPVVTREEAQANATLLGASLDLLTELENSLRDIGDIIRFLAPSGARDQLEKIERSHRGAIVKVRGGQS